MNLEQEWRQHLLSEIKDIKRDLADVKEEMTTLKIKVAIFSSAIGSLATFLFNKIFH
jgi:hypothetical protein